MATNKKSVTDAKLEPIHIEDQEATPETAPETQPEEPKAKEEPKPEENGSKDAKKAKKEEVKTTNEAKASVYTREELAKASRVLFDTSYEIVSVALKLAGIEKATVEEAKKLIEEFKNKEVK